jgi:flavin-dependent dehydrogenase
VALVEQKEFPRAKLCGEFISPECLDHFVRLGVLDQMNEKGGVSIRKTAFYSRQGRSLAVQSKWFGFGGVALGLSRAEMDNNLLLRARQCGVDVIEGTAVTGVLNEGDRICGIRTKCGSDRRDMVATLVVDATGRSRMLGRQIDRQANVETRRARLVAFKAHFANSAGADGVCEIYFYGGGYGGLNSVEGGLANLCFIASADSVKLWESDPNIVMQKVLMSNSRAAFSLRNATLRSEWLSVALDTFGRREPVPAPGLISVGDSAAFIDPFTGSGMLMALESGELAAKVAGEYLSEHTHNWREFADEYQTRYARLFNSRLRICSYLRNAAFVPGLASAAILAFGWSNGLTRRVARATRG